VIVGAGELGLRLVEQLESRVPEVRLIGIFDDRRDRVPHYLGAYPVLGTIDDLVAFAGRHRVDLVVVALPWSAESRLLACMRKLRNLPVDVRLCPDLIGFHLHGRGVAELAGVPLLAVYDRPLEGWGRVLKAFEDKVIAAAILLLTGPLMLAVAAAIRLESPGPALYRQKRNGFNNEIIEVLKFRTMYAERCADGTEAGLRQASRGDPRVTRLGRMLRRLSLDELPQLLNVLRGEMSIVGPRPHAVAHNRHYEPLIEGYLARHRVKPGITGWAQINGFRGATETVETMRRRVELDLHYIRNWSLLLDLRIIAATLLGGFTGSGAY
jgi:Undecaprenyl-phosphate glucose phosphotransferase